MSFLTSQMLISGVGGGAKVQWHSIYEEHHTEEPQQYSAKAMRRMTAASQYSLVQLPVAILGLTGRLRRPYNVRSICIYQDGWSLGSGLGAVQTETMIQAEEDWPTDLIPNIPIANTPQLLFSFLYFISNGILSKMALAVE
ncbi:hypothetical protein BDW71DRAFT_202560 [Aspergillus fruticulosus]